MQKRRSKRLRKLLGYVPEVFTIAYLVAYVVADQLYYSTPHLAMLADMGLTTRGFWTDYNRFSIVRPLNHSLEIPLKPWFRTPPPECFEGKDFDDLFVWREDDLRPLYPVIEDRIGGALVGIVPLAAKYAYKGVRPRLRGSE